MIEMMIEQVKVEERIRANFEFMGYLSSLLLMLQDSNWKKEEKKELRDYLNQKYMDLMDENNRLYFGLDIKRAT